MGNYGRLFFKLLNRKAEELVWWRRFGLTIFWRGELT